MCVCVCVCVFFSHSHELAIAEHLSDQYLCRVNYSDECFSVLQKAKKNKHLAI